MKVFISLAVMLTALPVAHAATSSPPPVTGATTQPASAPLVGTPAEVPELRQKVSRLTKRARAHSRRLGLVPSTRSDLDVRPRLLARRASRLQTVVGFLEDRREVGAAVDERATRRPAPPGRSLGARVTRVHSLAVRRALRLGVDRPQPLRLARTRQGRVAQLAHWRAVSRWLGARRERVRPDERPLSQRVRHYDALMCIARHEAGPEHGGWRANTGNGYYGRLQMDRTFQQTYAPRLYRAKGTADNWTPEEQLRTAARAVETRGFHPWPNTARTCGLI